MGALLLWDKRILVPGTTGVVGRPQAQGKHCSLPLEYSERQPLPEWAYHTMGFSKSLQSRCLLPVPSHPALQAVQRQGSGGTQEEGGVI